MSAATKQDYDMEIGITFCGVRGWDYVVTGVRLHTDRLPGQRYRSVSLVGRWCVHRLMSTYHADSGRLMSRES